MADLNRVFLIGRLTQDPELRSTPGGAHVSDLRLATSRKYTTKDGERREEKLFIDVTVWNRQAENCAQYLKKGRQIHVEGYLKMDSWDDRNTGEKRTKIKVEADHVQFLDSRQDDGPGGGGGGGDSYDDESSPAPAARRPMGPANGGQPARGGYAPSGGGGGAPARRPMAPPPAEEADDDIPF